MDGGTEGKKDQEVNKQKEGWVGGWKDGWKEGWLDRRKERRLVGWRACREEGRVDGWTDSECLREGATGRLGGCKNVRVKDR